MVDENLIIRAVEKLLPGQRVNIRFRRPWYQGFNGWSCKDLAGKLTILIDPELSELEQFKLLLHEAAHCKLHSKNYTRVDIDRRPGWSEQAPAVKFALHSVVTAAHQREADQLAGAWLSLAQQNSKSIDPELSEVDRLLAALGSTNVELQLWKEQQLRLANSHQRRFRR